MTIAVSECKISGSLGTSKLAVHVNLQVPAEVVYTESIEMLDESSRPVLVIFVSAPVSFKVWTPPDGDVRFHIMLLVSVTDSGWVMLQIIEMML